MTSQEFDLATVVEELGDPATWKRPTGYRSSLALCAMDSIWSIGIKYKTVENVLDLYLKDRGFTGLSQSQMCTDTPRDFLSWCESFGGHNNHETVAERLNNKNRTSSTNGVLKASAVVKACELLTQEGIDTTDSLLQHSEAFKHKWLHEISGQRSGISWKYLLMLAGSPGVKPDRMVMRFMERHSVQESLDAHEFVHELLTAINDSRITATDIDHRIWTIERSRQDNNGVTE
jgi:hypothetical protein